MILIAGVGDCRRVLLTKRAQNLTAHGGEVAFPGGKWEPGDKDLLATALRETREEVGIAPELVRVVGRLPHSYTRSGIQVTPYVGEVAKLPKTHACPRELDSLFWVAGADLLQDQRIRTDVFVFNGREYWAPAYQHLHYTIWGFTARVLVQFMNRYWGAAIERGHTPPANR